MSNFKVEIDEVLFSKMIESVKHCVGTNANRKIFEYIELIITDGKITALACDGYRAAKTTIPVCHSTTDEFKCYIKPIKIKPCKNQVNKVVIELENNIVTVEIMTEYGKIKYHFEQLTENGKSLNEIYKGVKLNTDREFGANPTYIKQAIAALSQMLNMHRKCVIFETQENNKAAFLIKAKEGKCISEQLILPMKINEN